MTNFFLRWTVPLKWFKKKRIQPMRPNISNQNAPAFSHPQNIHPFHSLSIILNLCGTSRRSRGLQVSVRAAEHILQNQIRSVKGDALGTDRRDGFGTLTRIALSANYYLTLTPCTDPRPVSPTLNLPTYKTNLISDQQKWPFSPHPMNSPTATAFLLQHFVTLSLLL